MFRLPWLVFAFFVAFVVNLFHRDFGGAGHPPLVILHGLLGSSRNWETAGAALAEKFHVCALDLRNHGRSPHAGAMTYAAMTEDVLGWLDARALPRAVLLGHSLGGKVAMRLACRHADRVERLVVVDIAPRDYSAGIHQAEFTAMNELDLAGLGSRAEAESRLEARVPDWAMRKFLLTNLERGDDGRWRWRIDLRALTAALPELEKNSLISDDRYRGSTLFILGEKSAYVQPADHATIRRHFPAARIETVAGAGHNPHMEMREELVRKIFEAANP